MPKFITLLVLYKSPLRRSSSILFKKIMIFQIYLNCLFILLTEFNLEHFYSQNLQCLNQDQFIYLISHILIILISNTQLLIAQNRPNIFWYGLLFFISCLNSYIYFVFIHLIHFIQLEICLISISKYCLQPFNLSFLRS